MSELTDEGERGQRPEAQKAKSECAAAQMYSDSRSNVPCQGKTKSYQIIKLSTIYTPIMPQKFGMEFAKVSLKVLVQKRGRFPRTRILINSHIYFSTHIPSLSFFRFWVSSLEVNHGFMVRSVLSSSSPLTWRFWVLHVSLWIAWVNWPEMLWQKDEM